MLSVIKTNGLTETIFRALEANCNTRTVTSSWTDAVNVLKAMFSFDILFRIDVSSNVLSLSYIFIALVFVVTAFNSNLIKTKVKKNYSYIAITLLLVSLMHMNHIYLLNDLAPEFLYFNF